MQKHSHPQIIVFDNRKKDLQFYPVRLESSPKNTPENVTADPVFYQIGSNQQGRANSPTTSENIWIGWLYETSLEAIGQQC